MVGESLPSSKFHEEISWNVKTEKKDTKKIIDNLSKEIKKSFADFKLDVEVLCRQEAPQLVRYKVKPAPGVKVISLANRADDFKVALSCLTRPLLSLPEALWSLTSQKTNRTWSTGSDVASHPEYQKHKSLVSFPVGIGVDNQIIIADFADPNTCHGLVAGASGSGKSEFLKSLVASLVVKNKPSS
jgi:DNA segregation ATPase FtsK/SpoIIIE, S-DNA-T family